MTPFNEHVRLADAILHGHLWISNIPPYMEHVNANGHDYILHPPLSGLLSIPFLLCGISDPQIISILIALVTGLLVLRLTRGNGWLTLFYLFGTTFAYEATRGASWDFALIASTPFTFGALIEIDKNNYHLPRWHLDDSPYDYVRPWLVGLMAGLAFLARYDLILATPIYVYVIIKNRKSRTACGQLGVFAAGLLPAILVYTWYNWFRFHTLTDPALWMWYSHDAYRFQVGNYGPFSLHYLPISIYNILFMAPLFSHSWPWFRPSFMGQSLLSLSPGLLSGLRVSPWTLAAGLSAIPSLTVYANGFSQLGYRYSTLYIPFFIMAMKDERPDKRLIVISIILTTYFSLVASIYGLA